MKFKKSWIPMNEKTGDQVESKEIAEETKEETKMNFFAKHKKGLILGGLGALAAGAAGLLIARHGSDDDYDEDEILDDDFDEEVGSEETAETTE